MVQRTQISLDPEVHRLARRRAADHGISLAEYVRRLVAADLEPHVPWGDRARVFDLGDSRGSDVARFRDAYVAQAVDAEHVGHKDA